MNARRTLRYLAPILAISTIIALPDLIQAGDKGGRGSAGQSASGRSGGSGGGSASATPSRRVGNNNGGLVGPRPHHGGGGTRVVIGGWPWWGYGVGWGWGGGWGYWGYDPWYSPYYSYYRPGYGYPVYGNYQDGPTQAAVELHISPRKASVKVDGYDVGQARDFSSSYTPLFLTPGDHILELSYPDHQTLKLRVHGAAGQGLDLRYDLADGEGIDPRSETAEVGMPGKPAENDESATPPPAAGQHERLRTGSIRVRVAPDDAAVYLDGEFLGMADELRNLHGALAIATGEHTLEAVRPGYRTQSIKVTVDAKTIETVKLELQSGTKD